MDHLASPRKQKVVLQNLRAAAAAAQRGLQRGGLGGGECLRQNFSLVVGTVQAQDGHLLSEEEHALLTRFQVSFSSPSSQLPAL